MPPFGDSRAALRSTSDERAESELVALRKFASELARERKERVTTVHLLVAMSSRPGPVADLLAERRLGAEALLKAGRSFDENDADALHRAMLEAKEIAQRARATRISAPDAKPVIPEPSAVHLFFALLSDRRCAAHRALLQCGVDVARLRTAALQVSIGFVAPRRPAPVAPPPRVVDRAPRAVSTARPPAPYGGGGAPPPMKPPPERVAPGSVPPPPSSSTAVAVPFMRPRAEHPRPTRVGARRVHAAASKQRTPAPAGAPTEAAPEAFPILRGLSRDLGVLALEGAFDHLVGREEEIDRALDVLGREASNVACFVGRIGSGTTSAATATAKRLLAEDRVLHELSLPLLSKGPGVRAHLAALRAELAAGADRVALLVDDLWEFLQHGDDVAQELRSLFQIPGLRVLTTCSPDGLRRAHEAHPGVVRALSPVEVDEPDVETAFLMVRARAALLEAHHGLAFSDEAVAAAIGWCKRYVAGRALPEKAVSVLDLAGARTKRRTIARAGKPTEVDLPNVAEIVAELTEVPVERLLQQDRERMIRLEAEIGRRVVGHADAIARISARIRQNAAGLAGERPIGSFLLLGPTGVGKTETAKALAHVLFGATTAMTRVDMSEYAESHSVARLIGAPPGYVGHESGGQLTEAVRQRPYQVVLLDEIEKAHRDVLEAFLQVLDEGHLTDGRGRKVDFKNAVIVLTSNLGAREVEAERTKRGVGFSGDAPVSREKLAQTSLAAARKELPPELYNRLDEVLFFAPLERDDVAKIASLLVEELRARLSRRGVEIDVQPEVVDALLDAGGFDASLGARPMRRTLSRLVEAPLADLVLRGELDDGRVALVGVEKGEITVDAVDGPRRIPARPT